MTRGNIFEKKNNNVTVAYVYIMLSINFFC